MQSQPLPSASGVSSEDFALSGFTAFMKGVREKRASLTFSELRKLAILDALQLNRGNVTQAAKTLGLGRTTLYRWARWHGIKLQREPYHLPLPCSSSNPPAAL